MPDAVASRPQPMRSRWCHRCRVQNGAAGAATTAVVPISRYLSSVGQDITQTPFTTLPLADLPIALEKGAVSAAWLNAPAQAPIEAGGLGELVAALRPGVRGIFNLAGPPPLPLSVKVRPIRPPGRHTRTSSAAAGARLAASVSTMMRSAGLPSRRTISAIPRRIKEAKRNKYGGSVSGSTFPESPQPS